MATPMPHPGVRFPPPFLFVGGLLAGWLIDRGVPLRLPSSAGAPVAEIAALVLGAAGLALAFWGLASFARAHTAILPHRPASRIVSGGPYRFTRNPMYVGLTALYLALTLLVRSWWPLVLLPAVLGLLVVLVIRREERYLAGAFGEEYEEYRRRVRRFL